MTSLLAVLLAFGGFGGYFVAATRFAMWRRVPWEFIAVTAAGALLGAIAFVSSPGLATTIAALASAGVLAFSLWYFLVYSQFGTREDRPRVGDSLPDFALPDSTGAMFRLSDRRGRRLLILFYRGDW
jgi:hypothetical protein